MKIEIDTSDMSELDIAMLTFLAGQATETDAAEVEAPEPAPAPAPKKAAPAKAAAPKIAAVPDPEPDEADLLGGDDSAPTMDDAVAAATVLVSSGKSAKVKEALAAVGAKKVSEVQPDSIADFIAALEA